jgi:hypothetical protein
MGAKGIAFDQPWPTILGLGVQSVGAIAELLFVIGMLASALRHMG